MDLHTVTQFHRPSSPEAVEGWKQGNSWLAGGTWLFSEPQISVTSLFEIGSFGWPSLLVREDGLEIGATCKIAELDAFVGQVPPDWKSAPLLRDCCRSLLASFKIWNEATVGGNLCMSLPAGAMISLTTALEGVCTLWPREGPPREVNMVDFVTGNNRNVLQPGELIRSIFIPGMALRKTYAFRRFSLTQQGRSSILVIGTKCPVTGEFVLTITASTPRPVQLKYEAVPHADELRAAIDRAVEPMGWFEDVHGSPAHRQHVTHYYAQQIREELSA